jgi:hypothetical protein
VCRTKRRESDDTRTEWNVQFTNAIARFMMEAHRGEETYDMIIDSTVDRRKVQGCLASTCHSLNNHPIKRDKYVGTTIAWSAKHTSIPSRDEARTRSFTYETTTTIVVIVRSDM